MKKQKQLLNFLGKGGAFNSKEGNNCAYIKQNDMLFLIDCGEDVFSKLVKFNLLDGIKDIHVYITHLHSDHWGSLSTLLYFAKFVLKIKATVYTAATELVEILGICGNQEEDYSINIMNDGDSISLSSDLYFTQIPVTHSEFLVAKGLYIKYAEHHIYYSGDSNNVLNEALDSIDNGLNTQYYQDTTTYKVPPHLHIEELIRLTTAEQRKYIYCMHLEGDDLIQIAKSNGFNVVKTISNNEHLFNILQCLSIGFTILLFMILFMIYF